MFHAPELPRRGGLGASKRHQQTLIYVLIGPGRKEGGKTFLKDEKNPAPPGGRAPEREKKKKHCKDFKGDDKKKRREGGHNGPVDKRATSGNRTASKRLGKTLWVKETQDLGEIVAVAEGFSLQTKKPRAPKEGNSTRKVEKKIVPENHHAQQLPDRTYAHIRFQVRHQKKVRILEEGGESRANHTETPPATPAKWSRKKKKVPKGKGPRIILPLSTGDPGESQFKEIPKKRRNTQGGGKKKRTSPHTN